MRGVGGRAVAGDMTASLCSMMQGTCVESGGLRTGVRGGRRGTVGVLGDGRGVFRSRGECRGWRFQALVQLQQHCSEHAQAMVNGVQVSSSVSANAIACQNGVAERVRGTWGCACGDVRGWSAPAPRPPAPPCGAPRTFPAVSAFYAQRNRITRGVGKLTTPLHLVLQPKTSPKRLA